MEGEDDRILWGRDFQRWRNIYQEIAGAMEEIERGEAEGSGGKRDGKRRILSQMREAMRFGELDEFLAKAVVFALERSPPEDEREERIALAAKKMMEKFRGEEQMDLGRVNELQDGIRELQERLEACAEEGPADEDGEKIRAGLEELEGGLEEKREELGRIRAERTGKDAEDWGAEFAEMKLEELGEEIAGRRKELGEAGRKGAERGRGKADAEKLKAEVEKQMGENVSALRELMKNRSESVRWSAAYALREIGDINAVVRFAYAEVSSAAREMAVEEIHAAARLGAELGREEKSMLLKMTEDMEPGIAEEAWALALKLFIRNELDGGQVGYLLQKETVEGEKEGADAAAKARLWLRVACSGGVEEGGRATALSKVEEAVWLGVELRPEEFGMLVNLIGKTRGEVACAAWSLAMELLERDALGKEETAELLLLSENIVDGRERERVRAKLAEKMPAEAEGEAQPAEPYIETAIGIEGSAGEAPVEEAGLRVIEIDDSIEEPAKKAAGSVEYAGAIVIEIDDGAEEGPAEEAPGPATVIGIDDSEWILADPLNLEMARLERGELKDEEIAELVVRADGIEDKAERKRVFDRMLDVLGPEKQLGNGKADKILEVERMSRLFLDTVTDGRPSGVPRRKGEPPPNAERKSVPPAEKVPAKG